MDKYNIAGLNVSAEFNYDRMKKNMPKYKKDFDGDADITISVDKQDAIDIQDGNPHLTLGACEYMLAGTQFYKGLLDHDGMLLHSSAIMMDGKAYLFSARSGTGKSTHTKLWQELYGEDKVVNFNDDKPALRVIDGKVYACGTPFSGKTDINLNVIVPLQAICFIERSEQNKIRKISKIQAIPLIINQTIFKNESEENRQKVYDVIGKVLAEVPVYVLSCNISTDAAKLAHDTMSQEG